jgi:hypothetical protein
VLDDDAHVRGVADQVRHRERALVREERVVHLPERVLGARRLRGLGGDLGVQVHIVER